MAQQQSPIGWLTEFMNAHSVNIYILDIKHMNISQPPSPLLLHFTLSDILTEMSCLVWILCRAARYTQHAKWLGHFLVVNTVNCQTSKRSGKGPQMMNPAYQVININVSSCHCLNWSVTNTKSVLERAATTQVLLKQPDGMRWLSLALLMWPVE